MSIEDKIAAYLASLGGGSVGSEKDEVAAANSVDSSSDTARGYADGGKIPGKDGPIIEDSTLEGFAQLLKKAAQGGSTDTPKGYAMGGNVDKNQVVMSAMGMPQLQGDLPVDGSTNYAVANGDGTLAAPPQATNAPVPAPAPQPVPQPQAAAPIQQPPAKQPSSRPPAQDLLAKLTDNDSDKMNALISGLQDQDKRGAFAQALAVIGDTLGNVGNARAGQTPEGFTGLKAVQGITDQNRQRMIDQLPMKLAADPNSQTSRLAQQTLMQAMNIQPNDPRAKSIMSMPAAAITQQMPQLGDSIKLQLEREKNKVLEATQANESAWRMATEKQTAAHQANEDTNTAIERDTNILKDQSPLNPGNWSTRDAAKSDLKSKLGSQSSAGQGHGIPDLGSTFNGHKVIKVTRIK